MYCYLSLAVRHTSFVTSGHVVPRASMSAWYRLNKSCASSPRACHALPQRLTSWPQLVWTLDAAANAPSACCSTLLLRPLSICGAMDRACRIGSPVASETHKHAQTRHFRQAPKEICPRPGGRLPLHDSTYHARALPGRQTTAHHHASILCRHSVPCAQLILRRQLCGQLLRRLCTPLVHVRAELCRRRHHRKHRVHD